MIRFNVIDVGFLDLAEGTSIGFKQENQHFRFADISLGRSVQFSIPATDRNRLLLGFGDDPALFGGALRTSFPCQMVYDGGEAMGTLNVTGFSSDSFSCVFYIGGSSWVDKLQKLKLSDCVTTLNTPVLWDDSTPVVDADSADPSQGVQLLKYDNGITNGTSWQYVPSVNVLTYISDILSELGVPLTTTLGNDLWMVSGSMKGGGNGTVVFDVTGTTSATIPTMTQPCFAVDTFQLEWSEGFLFGAGVGGGSTTAVGFRCTRGVALTFPSTMPNDVFLIKYNSKLSLCECLGGKGSYQLPFGLTWNALDGRTINIDKGDLIFFADRSGQVDPGTIFFTGGEYAGWKDITYPLNVACEFDLSQDIVLGDNWYLRDNHPDMTVFEFLKSVAIASGLELTIDPVNGVTLDAGSYGQNADFVNLKDVVSVDNVNRNVEAWGNNTVKAVIGFESEDYVEQLIRSEFDIPSEILQGEGGGKSGFSEGSLGDNGILILDVDGSSYKFKAKKWTIAKATNGSTYLQRVDTPDPVGYDDIAANSTCVKVKVSAEEADFFALKPSTTFLWRGMAYIWTDASLSAGIMSLTLQKVSSPPQYVIPPRYLTLKAESAGVTVRIDKEGANFAQLDAVLDYSTDGGNTWTPYGWTGDTGDTITLANIGDTVCFKGNNDRFSRSTSAYYQFIVSGTYSASGDVTTLIDENGGDVPLTDGVFINLFRSTYITQAPNLPSTALWSYCYFGMFSLCGSLTQSPELPATDMEPLCYAQMFMNSGLTSAPVLPALTLVSNCYSAMFMQCANLTSVEMHATDISAPNCLYLWLRDVSASGTLTCDSSLVLPSGDSGLPTGWTRVNI